MALTTKSSHPLLHSHPISVTSLVVSLLVGTVLTLSNHGDALFTGHLTLSLAWTIPLTYLLSFVLVAIWGPYPSSRRRSGG